MVGSLSSFGLVEQKPEEQSSNFGLVQRERIHIGPDHDDRPLYSWPKLSEIKKYVTSNYDEWFG